MLYAIVKARRAEVCAGVKIHQIHWKRGVRERERVNSNKFSLIGHRLLSISLTSLIAKELPTTIMIMRVSGSLLYGCELLSESKHKYKIKLLSVSVYYDQSNFTTTTGCRANN